jgi:uncharacterized protein (TIGR00251 family)
LSFCRPTTDGVVLTVRVIPRARVTAVGGVRDNQLIIRLTAPPVDDAANRELVAFLSTRLGVPARAIQMVSGARSRRKVLTVSGLTEDGCRRALER